MTGSARITCAVRYQHGAVLGTALILLLVLTLLAVTSMITATTELVMAGNEQYHQRALQAASAGIEYAIADLGRLSITAASGPLTVSDRPVAEGATDTYSTSTRYVGEELGLPQSSADKFVGLHFEIESTGRSARGALDVQVQGVLVIAPRAFPGMDFQRLHTGLGP